MRYSVKKDSHPWDGCLLIRLLYEEQVERSCKKHLEVLKKHLEVFSSLPEDFPGECARHPIGAGTGCNGLKANSISYPFISCSRKLLWRFSPVSAMGMVVQQPEPQPAD